MLKSVRLATLALSYLAFVAPASVYGDVPLGLVNGISPASKSATPPSFDDSEYKSYFSDGTSEIVLKPTFTLADGSNVFCRPGPEEEAVLFPGSEFTVWMVENWIYRLQVSQLSDYSTAYPGSNVRGLPDYLNLIRPTTIVRTAECNSDHEYVFTKVPVGNYVMYAQHINYVYGSGERSNSQLVQTPDGPHTETLPGERIDESHSTDGYLSYAPNRIVIDRPSRLYAVNSSHFHTVVHFKVDHS